MDDSGGTVDSRAFCSTAAAMMMVAAAVIIALNAPGARPTGRTRRGGAVHGVLRVAVQVQGADDRRLRRVEAAAVQALQGAEAAAVRGAEVLQHHGAVGTRMPGS